MANKKLNDKNYEVTSEVKQVYTLEQINSMISHNETQLNFYQAEKAKCVALKAEMVAAGVV